MSDRKRCLAFDDTIRNQITFEDFITKEMGIIERMLNIIAKQDENLIGKLLVKYEEILNELKIDTNKNDMLKNYDLDYGKNKWINQYPEYIPLVENATLHFLDISKYESQLEKGTNIDTLFRDVIRGETYPLFYLTFALQKIIPREDTLELAKEFTDLCYEIYKDSIKKSETLEEMAKSMYKDEKSCHKTHNYILEVKNGKYILKVTRCLWGDIYSDLPDLELASLLECYGDFSKMQYINPNFVLTRTKTLVEGHSCCDFVHHDKRIVDKIEHPDEEFWENFN